MQTAPQLAQLEQLAGGITAAAGLELVRVELKGQGTGRLLRVYVDQPTGVGLTECEQVSRALSSALDAREADGQELLAGPYTLEVSSPGLDRPLIKPSDFERFIGQRAQVRTVEAQNGCKSFTGILETCGDTGVTLRAEGAGAEAVTIAWDNIAQARLAPQWSAPARPRGKRQH